MSADPLVVFWTARLDEIEATAKAAAGETAAGWFTGTSEEPDERSVCYTGPSTLHPGSVWDYRIADRVPLAAAAHIACHDPARVLREVEADREILKAYEWVAARKADGGGIETDYSFRSGQAVSLETVIRCRAAVHRGHPDYRPEWGP